MVVNQTEPPLPFLHSIHHGSSACSIQFTWEVLHFCFLFGTKQKGNLEKLHRILSKFLPLYYRVAEKPRCSKPQEWQLWESRIGDLCCSDFKVRGVVGSVLRTGSSYACSKICFSLQGPFKNTKGLAVSVVVFSSIGIFFLHWKEQVLHWILLWNEIYASILRAKV